MADWNIYISVDSSGGRHRVPAGATYAKPGTFAAGGSPEFRAQLRDQNERHALALQAEVVENVRGSILRRNVSSGRLAAVTGDRRNVGASEFGYAVGRVDFLDRSIAKYWRQIEEGYAGHVGRTIYGFWGAGIQRVSLDAERVYAAPPWHRHGSRRGDMFIAATGFRQEGRFARYGADAEEGQRTAPNFARATTIKNPIEPHHDYARAVTTFRPGERGVREVTALLAAFSEDAWRARTARRGFFRDR